MSSGSLDLIGRLGVEVPPDGVVMHGGAYGHEKMPDGVSEGDDAIALEEDDAQAVTGSAHQQFTQSRLLRLQKHTVLIL